MYDVPESAASAPDGPDRYTFLGGSGHVRSQSSASLQDHPQTYSRLSYAEDAPIATVEEVEDNGDIYVRACPSHRFAVKREILQSEIRMQIFVKLGLRTHESSDGLANRRVV